MTEPASERLKAEEGRKNNGFCPWGFSLMPPVADWFLSLAFNLDYYTEVLDLSYLLDHLASDPFFRHYRQLNEKLVQLIEDYSLVSFIPLNIQVPWTKRPIPLTIQSLGPLQAKSTGGFEGSNSGLCPRSCYHSVPLVLVPGPLMGRIPLKRFGLIYFVLLGPLHTFPESHQQGT